MIEKVNPQHPDKVADRIAGALVDYAYTQQENPKVAFEVLIGHGRVFIIAETSVQIPEETLTSIVGRIAGRLEYEYVEVPQDRELAENQSGSVRAGDNGIFKGVPISDTVRELSDIAKDLYKRYPSDGKYILAGNRLIVCQSNAKKKDIEKMFPDYDLVVNPLGPWTGGTNVDTGAVNRKLGSDMGEAVTGGGLHGKDLSKADVSVNIYAHLLAQIMGKTIEMHCAIGDEFIEVNGKPIPYSEIVQAAEHHIKTIGGFEKLAEWGLV